MLLFLLLLLLFVVNGIGGRVATSKFYFFSSFNMRWPHVSSFQNMLNEFPIFSSSHYMGKSMKQDLAHFSWLKDKIVWFFCFVFLTSHTQMGQKINIFKFSKYSCSNTQNYGNADVPNCTVSPQITDFLYFIRCLVTFAIK